MANGINFIYSKLFILILIPLLLCVCSNKTKNIKPALPNTLTQNIDNVSIKNDKEQDNGLSLWVGRYNFEEYIPPNIGRMYSINIYKEEDNYFAEIIVDGFQTMIRLLSKVEGNNETIELKFYIYLPGNIGEYYNENDILLSFKKKNNEILTYWGEIESIYPDAETGKVFFTKE